MQFRDVRNRTLVRRSVRVDVHHGAHGSEEVPAHSHHGGEQILEAMEVIVEKGADASPVASVRSQEAGEVEDWGVEVDVISHLRSVKDTGTEMIMYLYIYVILVCTCMIYR